MEIRRDTHPTVKTHITEQEAAYWAKFYERVDFEKGSSFFEFINNTPSLPETIVDIGCGQGRDSFAFAIAGRRVIGLDRSDVGIGHASKKAVENGLSHKLIFSTCDVSDATSLLDMLSNVRRTPEEPIVFYMRFFLHSIPEEAQSTLLAALSDHTRAGDVFAAEFRTDKDEGGPHVFGDGHYRRYQNAGEFSKQLQDEYGWNISFETESRGLSPYKDEDPFLYRVVAVKS